MKSLANIFQANLTLLVIISVISSKTRGILAWWLLCLSLICLLRLIASFKLNNELYNLGHYLQSVSKWLSTWISKNQFVNNCFRNFFSYSLFVPKSHNNWLKLKLYQVGNQLKIDPTDSSIGSTKSYLVTITPENCLIFWLSIPLESDAMTLFFVLLFFTFCYQIGRSRH